MEQAPVEVVDATAVMIDDLARRVAAASVEASSWKGRALAAEQALARIQGEASADEAEAEQPEEADE